MVTHGAIAGHSEMCVTGAGPGFGLHIVDVEVDRQTGTVDIKCYTVVEDGGTAIHPLQVEGQYQGGAVQGIGWALNEEYFYGDDGRLQNASFLDYRMPVASDVPMIGTEIVEVPNPRHPYGLRGVGERPGGPTRAAIAQALGPPPRARAPPPPDSAPRAPKILDEAGPGGGVLGAGPGSGLPGRERAQLVGGLAGLIESNRDELAELESLNNGKPIANIRHSDLAMSCEVIRYTAGWATKLSGETISLSQPGNFHAYTVREPIGVVGQIIPWNAPLMMAAWKIAPALATGCTIVLKPAEQTPLTALRLGQL